jgi:membrane glycosyltransferase
MDAVAVSAESAAPRSADAFVFLPPESPLAMPEQTLRNYPGGPKPVEHRPKHLAMRRVLVLGAALAMTAFAADQMYDVLAVSTLTALEASVLVLFTILFAWISVSFVTSMIGFVITLVRSGSFLDIDAGAASLRLSARHALLVPTYNESPHRVFARLRAICESVAQTGLLERFDFYVLSDTTRPEIWLQEEAQFLLLQRLYPGQVFYRHRRYNVARKAGNIGDWVSRFGGRYDSMIVLDADSLMTGDSVVRIAAAIEAHPHVGLVQTLPVVVNGQSLFARVQQFAGRLYGPMLANGVAWWHGSDSNYWGHNAAIRVKAFADHARLPELQGRKPFGGHILSHDFVEAALMRRAGWSIVLVPGVSGSYEEVPPSIAEYAARDRRWCQGNLQHIKVLGASGLHWMSRMHFLMGIGAYLTAPIWLLFLLIGILISLQAHFIRPEYFPKGFSLFPQWPQEDPIKAAWVFAGTMGILIVPKFLSLLLALFNRRERAGFGGGLAAFASVVLEVLISGLIAPMMMLFQSKSVADVISGRDSGWQVQRRDDGSLTSRELWQRFGKVTLVGIALAASAYVVSLSLFLWMAPVTVGLLLAIPLAAITSRRDVGIALRRLRLFLTPEERHTPEVLRRANALADELRAHDVEPAALLRDASVRKAHADTVPAESARRRGEVDTNLVVANAKIEDATTLEEAIAFLDAAELTAVLSDRRAYQDLIATA